MYLASSFPRGEEDNLHSGNVEPFYPRPPQSCPVHGGLRGVLETCVPPAIHGSPKKNKNIYLLYLIRPEHNRHAPTRFGRHARHIAVQRRRHHDHEGTRIPVIQ